VGVACVGASAGAAGVLDVAAGAEAVVWRGAGAVVAGFVAGVAARRVAVADAGFAVGAGVAVVGLGAAVGPGVVVGAGAGVAPSAAKVNDELRTQPVVVPDSIFAHDSVRSSTLTLTPFRSVVTMAASTVAV